MLIHLKRIDDGGMCEELAIAQSLYSVHQLRFCVVRRSLAKMLTGCRFLRPDWALFLSMHWSVQSSS